MASIKTPRIGALTAEAVMRDYESAAKEIEAMGAELISAAKKWEAMTADVRKTIRDTSEAYREEGEKIFELIEKCALYTEDVRKTCEDLKRGVIEGNGGAR
jgi:DNA polymerase III gamma/tau subunit